MNYKSGDLVKITGNHNHHDFFIGETVRLQYKVRNNDWRAESLNGISSWYVMESDMAPVKPATIPQKIIITTDGKTTLARLFDGKTMVKRAEAKCAPSDTFDFCVGAELAVNRPMGAKPVTEPIKESEPVKLYCVKSYGAMCAKGKTYVANADGHLKFDNGQISTFETDNARFKLEWSEYLVPLVKRPAKVGEWVYIAEDYSGHHCKPGYIYMVNFKAENDGVYFKQDGTGYVKQSKYLVLSGYTGDPA